jgi:hypothetical protein
MMNGAWVQAWARLMPVVFFVSRTANDKARGNKDDRNDDRGKYMVLYILPTVAIK